MNENFKRQCRCCIVYRKCKIAIISTLELKISITQKWIELVMIYRIMEKSNFIA